MIARLDHRILAEEAYHDYLRLRERGAAPVPAEFVGSQSADVQEDLRRILGEHEFVLGAIQVFCTDFLAGQQFGPYRLLAEIGRGGMAVVWEAEQPALERRVAVKVLHGASCVARATMDRFKREARAGGRLTHPNITTVYETGEIEGCLYIAQELIRGGRNLAQHLAEARAWTEVPPSYYREEVERIAQVADALHAAHLAGVVHRDVKPSNILLDPEGRPKLGDFGLALLRDDPGLSESGEFIGTAFYASPEQAGGCSRQVDARSDVFSLGVTMYEALTLCRPFDGDGRDEVFRRIRGEEPLDPRRIRARIPRDLAVICLKALEKDPARRYPSAEAFAADLRRFLRNEPIQAHPPSALTRCSKWVRRHPTVSAAAAVGVLAAVALAAGGLRLAMAENRARTMVTVSGDMQQILVDVLALFYPEEHGRPAPTPEQVFQQVEQQVRTRFPDLPEVQADVYQSMASVLRAMGKLQEAERLARLALELRRATAAADLGSVAESAGLVAVILSDRGQAREAEALWRETCASFVAERRDRRDVRVVNLLSDYASFLADSGQHERAEGAFLDALEIAREIEGPSGVPAALVEGNLGVLYCEMERGEDALGRLATAISHLEARNGPEEAEAMIFRMNRGRALLLTTDVDAALAELLEVLPRLQGTFGAAHAHSIMCQVNLGVAYKAQYARTKDPSLLQQALEVTREAARAAVEFLHPGEAARLLAQENLGLLQVQLRNFAEAEPVLLAALGETEAHAPHNPRIWKIHYGLGQCARNASRFAEAARWFRRVLELNPNQPAVQQLLLECEAVAQS